MIVSYLRSSSIGCWSFCGQQFFLAYTLGLKPDEHNGWTIPRPQFKADLGNALHKALELLARKKVAIQNGESEFSESEIGKTWKVTELTEDDAFEEAWHFYSKIRCPHWDWSAKDYRKFKGLYVSTLELNGGMWNPLNRDVVQPEQFFDLIIDREWARYNYLLPNGTRLEGQLAIKGTVDLLTREDSETLHYIDWKSGMRKDWASGKPKDWKKLRRDPQLMLYHYALTRLYPEVKHFILTIVYCQDGGAFSLDFGPDDIPKTEAMLRERFETIRDCQRPPRIKHDPTHSWKCNRLCAFGMNEWEDTGKMVCDHIHGELLSLGMDRVVAKYGRADAYKNYGSGGGVEDRDSKLSATAA